MNIQYGGHRGRVLISRMHLFITTYINIYKHACMHAYMFGVNINCHDPIQIHIHSRASGMWCVSGRQNQIPSMTACVHAQHERVFDGERRRVRPAQGRAKGEGAPVV